MSERQCRYFGYIFHTHNDAGKSKVMLGGEVGLEC